MRPGMLSRSATRGSLVDTPRAKAGQRRLPRLLHILRCTGGRLLPDMVVTLPSNMAFRMTNYFKLLDAQKQRKESEETGIIMAKETKPVSIDWEVETPLHPESKRPRRSTMEQPEGVIWLAKDIIKAATLLKTQIKNVKFEDEEEMRRVFTLLYDVFRYKTILKDALDETGFSDPQSKASSPLVWLLFYDLYSRRFLPREHGDQALCKNAFTPMGLISIEEDLWQRRVKLAAALARSRIKNRAHQLNELLPKHLRDERLLSVDLAPATGWVNTFLISKQEMTEELTKLGILIEKTEEPNEPPQAKYDHACPKVVSVPATMRSFLAKSSLVKNGRFILQDKAFCLGPTYINNILKEVRLRGTVAQSHIISPRATAYLATILLDNANIEKVIAFGTGNRTEEYQKYFQSLGVINCELYKERARDIPHDSPLLENVVAVLVSPPTSWTGVANPVDLVCSRSGDMAMLRDLTQNQRGRDALLLEEQRDTLRFFMSLPQVQVIIYESHSTCNEENTGMVQSVTDCMNEWARQKHAEEQRIQHEQEEAEEKAAKALLPGGTPAQREQREREALEAQEALAFPMQVQVPPCDLFVIRALPSLCSHGSKCYEEEGCFVARIERKEVIGLDDKYMINIAEARGLFGSATGRKRTPKNIKKQEELQRSMSSLERTHRPRRHKISMDRITAHTHASLTRSCVANESLPSCERCRNHIELTQKRRIEYRKILIRTWWHETFQYVIRLLPYWRLTPRTRAVTKLPPFKLSRTLRRQLCPMHTVVIPEKRGSEQGESKNDIGTAGEIRRYSC